MALGQMGFGGSQTGGGVFSSQLGSGGGTASPKDMSSPMYMRQGVGATGLGGVLSASAPGGLVSNYGGIMNDMVNRMNDPAGYKRAQIMAKNPRNKKGAPAKPAPEPDSIPNALDTYYDNLDKMAAKEDATWRSKVTNANPDDRPKPKSPTGAQITTVEGTKDLDSLPKEYSDTFGVGPKRRPTDSNSSLGQGNFRIF